MILAVIPARYASTRFPGKPLIDLGGKTMIQRVFEQVSAAQLVDKVVVATDDTRILAHVQQFGGDARMTRDDHPSGTDRCAEIARQFPEALAVLNIQGDEPFILPAQIDLLAQTLLEDSATMVATLAKKITSEEELFNPNVVKVVFSQKNRAAIYFSRHAIPFVRGAEMPDWLLRQAFFKHIGLYAFRRETLLQIADLPPTPLERAESLEQLRWIENGFSLRVGVSDLESVSIDTPQDLERISPFLTRQIG
jgi:3-deoxy-manno-octulosonate cytidylyltransferase (CMP-KDO synthetase)